MLAGTCLCGAVRYETSAEPCFDSMMWAITR
jgi:hypothetical protein